MSGTVTDETGTPLAGANIVEKGTTNGVTADFDGNYSIDLSDENATLIVSYIGYTTKEVEVGGQTAVNVELAESATGLDEVVVIGYGTQKKVSLTSAVASVDGEDLKKRTVTKIEQSLQGNVSGLTVQDLGGAPGTSRMNMRIRGITTLSGNNEPLVIIDGVEQPLTNINPNDIETLSVLKDASSTAIYGSRASNGVILVTTKRGKEGKVNVYLNSYYGFQKSNNNPVHMGVEDYMRMQNIAWTNSSGSPIYSEEYIQEYVSATDRIKYPLPNNWFETLFKTAPQTNTSVTISGGTDKMKSLLSVRYFDEEGIIPNSSANTTDVRFNSDFQIHPKIKISSNFNYRYIHSANPINVDRVINGMLQNSQWIVPRYPDGTYGVSSDGQSPLVRADLDGTDDKYQNYFLGNLKGEWEIVNGLKFSVQYGISTTIDKQKRYSNKYEIFAYNDPSKRLVNKPINTLYEDRDDNRETTLNTLLNYSKTFGNHDMNILAGYSEIDHDESTLYASRQNFYSNDIQSISQGANDATKDNNGVDLEWRLRSYFGRLNYSFKDRYLFEANIRYDGSSRFASGNEYSTFPSFAAGWRLSEEGFWSGLKETVSEFKLRGSYGKSGNQAVDPYSYLAAYDLRSYSFGENAVQGYKQTLLSNKDITWETTTQTDIGMDLTMLKNKISLTVDYYHKETEDILLEVPVPATLGLLSTARNTGKVDNKGWEFALGLRNNFGDFKVDTNFNFSVNNNEVIDLAGTGPYIRGGNESRFITKEGLPINSWWGYKTDGYFQTQEEIANYPTIISNAQPGDVKFLDNNDDGVINPDDMVFLGESFPRYNFGASLNFTYKPFTLNMLFQGAAGFNSRLGGALAEMGIWGGFTHEVTRDYWTPENPNARFPRPLKFDLRNIIMADRDLLNGNYLRLKNIQLEYRLPKSLIDVLEIQSASVYVATTNLFTISELNDFNIDPEEEVARRAERYPQTAITTLGVNINF
ncbi:TonB-dependent receptor [Pricia sp. S334]|uniref:TonB-dependent receptor n=1 Tax=Pricia mediterranea TaxID=3076079 RepID=A0ABU3L3X3_9FLAO|nr:TonB-dependent receptor [Pricia sp. S334]MDT7828273.1 TonB-dependent receptor [Pricia sp. S334]